MSHTEPRDEGLVAPKDAQASGQGGDWCRAPRDMAGRAGAPEPSLLQGASHTSPFLWEPSILHRSDLRQAVAQA